MCRVVVFHVTVAAMKVTFDSNTFRKVINPALIKDPREREIFMAINEAISSGVISPYFSSAMLIMEEAPRKKRAEHLAMRRTTSTFTEREGGNGKISGQVMFGPDNSTATPLSNYTQERLQLAKALGFNMIHLPRFGVPLSSEVTEWLKNQPSEDEEEFHRKNELKGVVVRRMKDEKVGPYRFWILKDKVQSKVGSLPANAFFTDPEFLSVEEQKSMGSIVAEKADGDLIAAHIGEGLDIICTEDKAGGSSTKSVFSSQHRKWLSEDYGCKFLAASELYDLLQSVSDA